VSALWGRTRYPSGNFSMAVLIFSDSVFSMRSWGLGWTNPTTGKEPQASKKQANGCHGEKSLKGD
uniref:hypothetical protein n=1 Tax=Penaeicola halotolerans TaxID=2793196 RepID=UPI001CF8A1D4